MTTADSFERQVRRRAEAIGLRLKKSRRTVRRPWSFVPASTWPPTKTIWDGRHVWFETFVSLDEASDRLTEFEAETGL